jgi:hypothetical protein
MDLWRFLLLSVILSVAGCSVEDDTRAGAALDELSSAYDQIAGSLATESGEAVEWARGDIENLGDWEYRIIDFGAASPAAIEAELNELGNERWEAFWIQPSADGIRIYLKRTSLSLVSKVPLTAIVRALGGSGSE